MWGKRYTIFYSGPPTKGGQHFLFRRRCHSVQTGRKPWISSRPCAAPGGGDVRDSCVIELRVETASHWYLCDTHFRTGPLLQKWWWINSFDKPAVKLRTQTDRLTVYIKGASTPSPFGTGSQNVGSLCEATQGAKEGRECPPQNGTFVFACVMHRKK